MKTLKTLFTLVLLLGVSSMFAQNLSLSGSATALSGTASRAIDGNDGTRWESEHDVDPQWFALTLDNIYSIDHIKIHWEAANAKVYTIKVSTDSATWSTVYSETDGASGDRWDDITFTATDAKYIVVEGTERNLTYGYSIWELEVYEVLLDDENATLSDLQVDDLTISGFESGITDYTYLVSDGIVPTVTATPDIAEASVSISPAASIPGTTSVEVTASNGMTTEIYTINFRAPVGLPIDFESSTLLYQWGEFGAPASVIDNPHISGSNTSAKVTQIIKNAGADWSGSYIVFDTPIDLSVEPRISAKFYSPRADINMMMKLETASGIATAELQVPTTKANEWETLTFDFSAEDASKEYVKVVIICDRATEGDGTADHTYLLDDIAYYEEDPAKDATLSDLMVDGVAIEGFSSTTLSYEVELAEGTTTIPVVSATPAVNLANAVVTQAATLPGDAIIVVTAQDNTITTYTVSFTVATGNTACSGTSTDASDGSFILGYNYDFTTSGTDVTVTFEMLDSQVGLVAFLWNRTDGFVETQMTADGNVFTLTLSDQVVGTELTLACKFAYSGGYAVTTDYQYTVGDDCSGVTTGVNSIIEGNNLTLYPNPVQNELFIESENAIESMSLYSLNGQLIKRFTPEGASIDLSNLEKGIYLTKIQLEDGSVSTNRIIKL